jgi:Bacterial Ig-like domain (group 1)
MVHSPRARAWLVGAAAVAMTGASLTVAASPASAQSYTVRVTCNVPAQQKERQLAPNWCLNYLPDGTQTFIAHVKDSKGNTVSGVTVTWSDSDSNDAYFRSRQNPCKTGSGGTCSAEIVDKHPRDGEKITVTATVSGSTGKGYLSFTR